MIEPDNKTFILKDGWGSQEAKEKQRLHALSELSLRQPETIPVFEEATQTAAHFLDAPICVLGFMDDERHWFKSAVGLSRLGLMNQLAQTRQLNRGESFCATVVETAGFVTINDTHKQAVPEPAASRLVHDYGIRAYLGAPLIDAQGNCLGALAVMDLVPRNFATRDIEFLQIIARWSMSEFERNRMLQGITPSPRVSSDSAWGSADVNSSEIKISAPNLKSESAGTSQIKLLLLGQLTEELRTPLTSVLGMASVLGREIYGPLTGKQREYLEIIQHSGRYLLSLVNEISELGAMDESAVVLNISPVDVEMLCQQAINTLEEAANRREQNIRLSIEPGRGRIWALDKDKVRQILYHLIFSVIQLSATGSIVRIHVSYKDNSLNITIWVSHPWLGDGITDVDPYLGLQQIPLFELGGDIYNSHPENQDQSNKFPTITEASTQSRGSHPENQKAKGNLSRESLGLLLSSQLAELHGGGISIQGSSDSGYRYVLSLPLQAATADDISDESIKN
ncbi:MAG: GAF domain-containing sensor histidine kinase [Cyanobacteria bacterium P01_A01_bin.45]